ncbi:uncharacterized protein [Watersipora subatra]|uniref:uncharacterized protein n=1 Tax=Watersipora subatra TaxID=2589382 RepID=UPI00355B6B78
MTDARGKQTKKAPPATADGTITLERVEATPPFTHVGLDVCGPLNIRERRTELKRWGLMVTCMYSRAVHIEVLDDLSTDNLIQALRCIIAIRGPIKTITSDNGTNFVGASNELEKEWNAGNLQNYLLTSNIEWKFNAPLASNQGGATERMIRSARAVLSAIALKYKGRMHTKTLQTAFHEAANVINSRPLTATLINSPDEQIITPNLLLNMKGNEGALPPAEFPKEAVYGNKRWKVAQAIAQEFWPMWKSEYLGLCHAKTKMD